MFSQISTVSLLLDKVGRRLWYEGAPRRTTFCGSNHVLSVLVSHHQSSQTFFFFFLRVLRSMSTTTRSRFSHCQLLAAHPTSVGHQHKCLRQPQPAKRQRLPSKVSPCGRGLARVRFHLLRHENGLKTEDFTFK